MSTTNHIKTITEAQQLVKDFAKRNNWDDSPNIDKFDHLHEELIEMSRLLRYKTQDQRIEALAEHHDELVDGREICSLPPADWLINYKLISVKRSTPLPRVSSKDTMRTILNQSRSSYV